MPESIEAKRIERALVALRQIPDPMRRLDAVRRAREALEALETDTVLEARAAGATWSEIGSGYGLSKQGAQQRFRLEKVPAKGRRTGKGQAGDGQEASPGG